MPFDKLPSIKDYQSDELEAIRISLILKDQNFFESEEFQIQDYPLQFSELEDVKSHKISINLMKFFSYYLHNQDIYQYTRQRGVKVYIIEMGDELTSVELPDFPETPFEKNASLYNFFFIYINEQWELLILRVNGSIGYTFNQLDIESLTEFFQANYDIDLGGYKIINQSNFGPDSGDNGLATINYAINFIEGIEPENIKNAQGIEALAIRFYYVLLKCANPDFIQQTTKGCQTYINSKYLDSLIGKVKAYENRQDDIHKTEPNSVDIQKIKKTNLLRKVHYNKEREQDLNNSSDKKDVNPYFNLDYISKQKSKPKIATTRLDNYLSNSNPSNEYNPQTNKSIGDLKPLTKIRSSKSLYSTALFICPNCKTTMQPSEPEGKEGEQNITRFSDAMQNSYRFSNVSKKQNFENNQNITPRNQLNMIPEFNESSSFFNNPKLNAETRQSLILSMNPEKNIDVTKDLIVSRYGIDISLKDAINLADNNILSQDLVNFIIKYFEEKNDFYRKLNNGSGFKKIGSLQSNFFGFVNAKKALNNKITFKDLKEVMMQQDRRTGNFFTDYDFVFFPIFIESKSKDFTSQFELGVIDMANFKIIHYVFLKDYTSKSQPTLQVIVDLIDEEHNQFRKSIEKVQWALQKGKGPITEKSKLTSFLLLYVITELLRGNRSFNIQDPKRFKNIKIEIVDTIKTFAKEDEFDFKKKDLNKMPFK